MGDVDNDLNDKLIFGKYKILRTIGKGCFSKVYLGINISNKKLFAIKVEKKFIENPILENEAYILFNMKGPGIPSVVSFGHFKKFKILVQTLLGKSLRKIWVENNGKLNIKDICMIAIQTLERIEYIHSKDYIHRDIKPDNFLVGNPDNSQIYIIDFGNARKYRSSRTKKHIKNIKQNKVFGTIFFLSLNVLRGNEQSRRDDLESLGYMYIYLYKSLPWCTVKSKTMMDLIYKTKEIKEKLSIEQLCENMPTEMCVYMKYVRDLTFDQEPDYIFLRKLFLIILKKFELKNDNLFSWVDPNKIIHASQNNNRARSNPQTRLMNKIIESSHSKINIQKANSLNDKSRESLMINKNRESLNNDFTKDTNDKSLNIITDKKNDKSLNIITDKRNDNINNNINLNSSNNKNTSSENNVYLDLKNIKNSLIFKKINKNGLNEKNLKTNKNISTDPMNSKKEINHIKVNKTISKDKNLNNQKIKENHLDDKKNKINIEKINVSNKKMVPPKVIININGKNESNKYDKHKIRNKRNINNRKIESINNYIYKNTTFNNPGNTYNKVNKVNKVMNNKRHLTIKNSEIGHKMKRCIKINDSDKNYKSENNSFFPQFQKNLSSKINYKGINDKVYSLQEPNFNYLEFNQNVSSYKNKDIKSMEQFRKNFENQIFNKKKNFLLNKKTNKEKDYKSNVEKLFQKIWLKEDSLNHNYNSINTMKYEPKYFSKKNFNLFNSDIISYNSNDRFSFQKYQNI